jgi:phenylalanyl-tRNA synthetase alpha chain
MKMIDKIKNILVKHKLFPTQDAAELEAFRIKFLGSKGLLKAVLPNLKCS